jgi:hypothetical protein
MVVLSAISLSFAASAVAAAQIPSPTPTRPNVVERFLGQYAQQHPLTPGAPGQQPALPSQSVNAFRPKLIGPQSAQQGHVCAIPLLRVEVDPTKKYEVRQVTPPAIDQSMVMKPAVPSCEETRSK